MNGDDGDTFIELEKQCTQLRKICDKFVFEEHMKIITNAFRLLRRACSLGSSYQNFVAKQGLVYVEKILDLVINNPNQSESETVATRLGIQVLGNMVVNNKETQMLVWEKCALLLSHAIHNQDEKISNYSAMVLHNIILGHSSEELIGLNNEIVKGLLKKASNDSEFGQFAVESLLSIPNWFAEFYSILEPREKYYLLDLISENISSPSKNNDGEKKEIHHSAIRFISAEFCARSDKILDMREDLKMKASSDPLADEVSDMDDPCEITKLLDVLASATSNEKYLSSLQSDGPLLVQTIYLLKSIHAVGKIAEEEGKLEHPFASIQRLSTFDSKSCSEKEDLESHPVFGFKRNIIRLIGNLSWKNKDIQDQILELECVPLILDCCNIDARNPFITQWAILAIRNLCDGNAEVQKLITSLKKEGVINCDLLNEMGLTLHDSGDSNQKISIVPLPR